MKFGRISFYANFSESNLDIFRSDKVDLIHDENTKKFIECIQTSHDICGPDSLVAIKITALIQPNILKKFNAFLSSLKDSSFLPSLFEIINQEQTNQEIRIVGHFQLASNAELIEDQAMERRLNSKFLYSSIDEYSFLLLFLEPIIFKC